MTKQIMKLDYYGTHIIVTNEEGKTNPFRIYRKWFSLDDCGWHRNLVEKYADFESVIWWLHLNRDNICYAWTI